jgi:hypothetical protein
LGNSLEILREFGAKNLNLKTLENLKDLIWEIYQKDFVFNLYMHEGELPENSLVFDNVLYYKNEETQNF